jgi:ketosteroid isomerase-like protein
MLNEDLDVIRRWVEAFNHRDLETLVGLSDPDCEMRPYLAAMIEATTYRGHQGLRAYFEDADAAWDLIRVALREDFREVGDRLVGSVEIYGRARASGLEVRVPVSWVAEIANGTIKRLHAFTSEAEALQAAGLPE